MNYCLKLCGLLIIICVFMKLTRGRWIIWCMYIWHWRCWIPKLLRTLSERFFLRINRSFVDREKQYLQMWLVFNNNLSQNLWSKYFVDSNIGKKKEFQWKIRGSVKILNVKENQWTTCDDFRSATLLYFNKICVCRKFLVSNLNDSPASIHKKRDFYAVVNGNDIETLTQWLLSSERWLNLTISSKICNDWS